MQKIDDFISVIGANKANLTVDTSLYNLETIYAASYEFTHRYYILLNSTETNQVTVIFETKDKAKIVSDDLKDFTNALIDHQIRRQLEKANGKIRELIVAHAFSPIDLNEAIKCL